MSSIHLEIRRDDLRALVKHIDGGDVASLVEGLAGIFLRGEDIESQTIGLLLGEMSGLPDGDGGC